MLLRIYFKISTPCRPAHDQDPLIGGQHGAK